MNGTVGTVHAMYVRRKSPEMNIKVGNGCMHAILTGENIFLHGNWQRVRHGYSIVRGRLVY